MRRNKWRGEEQWGRRRGSSLLTEKMTYVTPDTPTATDPPLSSLTHTSALNTVRLQEGKCPFSGCRTARHIYSIRTPQPVKSFPSQKETNPLLNSALGTKIQLNHQKCRRHQSRLLISRHYTDDVLGALSRVQQQVKVILSNVDKVFNPAGPSNE